MPQYNTTGGLQNLADAMANAGQQVSNQGGKGGQFFGNALDHAGSALGNIKNKDAPSDEMSDVPMATGSFYQPMERPARSQLLETMMQRSRMGRNQGT